MFCANGSNLSLWAEFIKFVLTLNALLISVFIREFCVLGLAQYLVERYSYLKSTHFRMYR